MRVGVVIVAMGEDPDLATALRSVRAQSVVTRCVVVHHAAASAERGGEASAADGGARAEHTRSGDVDGVVHLRTRANPGFAAGFNRGLAELLHPAETCEPCSMVLSLNPDATLDPAALREAVRVLAEHPQCGAVALRLVRPEGNILDSAGIRMDWLRRGRDRGMGGPAAGAYAQSERVDAACMAAALFRVSALQEARDGAGEVLDARFFAYKEDVDLGWRLRRAGWEVRYEPRASATHRRGWREGQRARVPQQLRVYSLGNRWLTILKNESALGALLRLAPWLLQECVLTSWLLLREPRTLAGYVHALRGVAGSLRRRRLRGKSCP